ncbi:MAG: penicillin-binding protein activator LpoB [Alphaproteobacteria bacterium]|nr:penicillin-binding protein activator LpoB [Alphaproteobacteria bacterium]
MKLLKSASLCAVLLCSACALDPYMDDDQKIATANWTTDDTNHVANEILTKLTTAPKLVRYISGRPNETTITYLAQFENKTDKLDMDSAKVALNSVLKEKLINEIDGFEVIDPQNKAIEKEIKRQYGGTVTRNTMVSAAKQLGADTLITGVISGDRNDVGGKTYQIYTFDVEFVQVETSRVLATAHTTVRKQQKAQKVSW